MHRPLAALCLVLLVGTACSDDSSGETATTSTQALPTIPPDATTLTGDTFAPQTTFMPDCVRMPTAADLSAIVGIPLDEGQVTATGTCAFLGLNDQSRSITLSLFTDPVDQASFNDLQASIGPSRPYDDAALAGAQVGAGEVLFINANNGIYVVQSLVNDTTPTEQLPIAVEVLKAWLTL